MGTLPNPNLPVTEERLQEFYQQIKPYLGLREMPSGDMSEIVSPKPVTAKGGHRYSTEEQIVGTWIDGSTLYEKTIDLGTFPNATVKTVAHDISNIDTVANVTIVAKNGSGGFLVLPYIYDTNTIIYGITSTSISIIASQDRSNYTGYATVRYTKTA